MGKDLKVLIAGIAVSLVTVFGFASVIGGSDPETLDDIVNISVSPAKYELGDVTLEGGNITRKYEVANTTGDPVILKRISTSCMCTEASLAAASGTTKFYGMEHGGSRNPVINQEIAPGETAIVSVIFDPAAHGPAGIGPFERTVWLTFADPGGVKELWFDGTVISN